MQKESFDKYWAPVAAIIGAVLFLMNFLIDMQENKTLAVFSLILVLLVAIIPWIWKYAFALSDMPYEKNGKAGFPPKYKYHWLAKIILLLDFISILFSFFYILTFIEILEPCCMPTKTPTPTVMVTPTATQTTTTATVLPTITPSLTVTSTFTPTHTSSPSPTNTPLPSPSNTPTPTPGVTLVDLEYLNDYPPGPRVDVVFSAHNMPSTYRPIIVVKDWTIPGNLFGWIHIQGPDNGSGTYTLTGITIGTIDADCGQTFTIYMIMTTGDRPERMERLPEGYSIQTTVVRQC